MERTMTWLEELDAGRRADLRRLFRGPRAERAREHAEGDDEYGLWLMVVDIGCRKVDGRSAFDLADTTWREWFDEGLGPKEALRLALRADNLRM
jgi:hypothetical protein